MGAKRQSNPLLWLLRCLGMVLLTPSLTQAAVLEIPSDGADLSGIGVISGWKCEAEGDITIRFNDRDPIPATYGFPRGDTRARCGDDDGNNGFYSFFNWALLGDGQHTAVAYDNGKKFASSTFEVTTLGEEFVEVEEENRGPFTILDFPSDGEEAQFEWNEATQHLELVSVAPISPEETCKALEVPIAPPPGPLPPPLVLPPPLPCPRDETAYQGEKYLIRFHPPFYPSPGSSEEYACTSPRGIMQMEIQEGRFSASTRAPPHGRVEVSGEVCEKESGSLFVGKWWLDGSYKGYFTGSLADLDGIACASRWHDTAGCRGDLVIQPLP